MLLRVARAANQHQVCTKCKFKYGEPDWIIVDATCSGTTREQIARLSPPHSETP